ncbi:hypothetical protein EV421DRAFT_1744380 [Armillaria borealis]|uniref:Uncharacterized protein n=1 Tax=Armillaria borealis TaxID=47425 RepID=A0AA39MDF6_9AGAR|nr:hypothetical protein EV421DRAFT_1744380 [Armillaria borealis]
MSALTMIDMVKAAIEQGHTLPSSIGHFQGIPLVQDDILPNLMFALHPMHTVKEVETYECMLDGLKNLFCTYLITTGHPHSDWNHVVAYPPGVRSLEWTSLRYEMLYAAAFPHMNPGQESTIQFFCKVWSVLLPENVARMIFLPAINDDVGGCIVNIDYELFDALEAMANVDLTQILHELTMYGYLDDTEEEYSLSHNWVHAELLNTIEDGLDGLLRGELLDEAEILLAQI